MSSKLRAVRLLALVFATGLGVGIAGGAHANDLEPTLGVPGEIWQAGILSQLPSTERHQFCLVNKQFAALCNDPKTWESDLLQAPADLLEHLAWRFPRSAVIAAEKAHRTRTLAGDGEEGFTDEVGTAAQFYSPIGIAVSPAGIIYIADTDNHAIRGIHPDGQVSTVAGNGGPGYVDNIGDNIGNEAEFSSPQGIALDAAGTIYVTDTENHAIRAITPDGQVYTVAGSGEPGLLDGNGTEAQFDSPRGIALDAGGNIYVADTDNNAIRKITPGGQVSTLISPGDNNISLNSPHGIAVNAAGVIYLADTGNHAIRAITSDGRVSIVAGNGSIGTNDGPSAAAQFSSPEGIALDAAGAIYIADTGNNSIRKITADGQVSTFVVARPENLAPTGDSGEMVTESQLYSPMGLGVDNNGNIVVVDSFANMVHQYFPYQ